MGRGSPMIPPGTRPEDQYADTVAANLPLAGQVRLDPSRPLRFGFTVPVPPRLPAPTMRTPNFTLSWILRGVVDRQLRRDPLLPSSCTR